MTTEQELRKEIDAIRDGHTRWRCPLPLRERIVSHAMECKRQGVALGQTAKALGLSESSLLKWVRKTKGCLRRVRISQPSLPAAELALIAPGGYRLEGLDAATAAEVLRRLGC